MTSGQGLKRLGDQALRCGASPCRRQAFRRLVSRWDASAGRWQTRTSSPFLSSLCYGRSCPTLALTHLIQACAEAEVLEGRTKIETECPSGGRVLQSYRIRRTTGGNGHWNTPDGTCTSMPSTSLAKLHVTKTGVRSLIDNEGD